MMASNQSAEDRIKVAYSSCRVELRVQQEVRHAEDAFIGVRISWLDVRQKLLLAEMANSAATSPGAFPLPGALSWKGPAR